MKRLRNWLVPDWYQMLLFLVGLFFVGFLLWFQLGTLVPGLSQAEATSSEAVHSLHDIRANPLNFPFKLLQWGFLQFDIPTPAVRLSGTVIGLVVLVCLFYILRSWYTRRVAILGSLLFVCSAWFLHTARYGTDSIIYALLIATVAATVWLQNSRRKALAIIASALLIVCLLYIPGMIWFVVPLILWQLNHISRFVHRENPALLTMLLLLGVALLTPLALAFYQHPELIKPYFGLPETFPTPLEMLRNIITVPIQLFFRGPDNPQIWLGRLPLLSWFSILMFITGGYAYWRKRTLDRTKFMVYVFAVGTLLVALGGPMTNSVLLPFVYLVVTGGIALLLQQWFTVFPRNPVARTFGPTLMTIAVVMAAYYNINHYFIAWPNAPETKEVFQESFNPQIDP